MEEKLELRMYGLVNYQLTGIQKGIQFLHAVVEYQLEYGQDDDYLDWAENHKTVILLNGGTTNLDENCLGTINKYYSEIKEIGIKCSAFKEPDLGNQITSVSFIVDERVFNRKKYLDLGDWIWTNRGEYLTDRMITTQRIDKMHRNGYFQTDANKEEMEIYAEWVDSIGGEKNVKLRDFLSGLKLA
jgi:hypothetical protein